MKGVVYYSVLLLSKIINNSPVLLINVLSNTITFLLKDIIHYRNEVIHTNLKNAFPAFSDYQIKEIKNKFYKNLSTALLHSIKSFSSVSKNPVSSEFENLDLLIQSIKNGKSFVIVSGHFFHWEELLSLFLSFANWESIVLYQPIKNKLFDNRIKEIRESYGIKPVTYKELFKVLNANTKPVCLLMLADQNPANNNRIVWDTFLNQETAFMDMPFRIAKKYNMNVFYINVKRSDISYKLNFIPLHCTADNDEINVSKTAKLYIKELEKNIQDSPENWLWSHKRWKMK